MKFITVNNTKKYVLENYSQVGLFARYLGIAESDIEYCIQSNRKICNTLRGDKNPSLSFRWFGSKLRMKDYANNTYNGDIFDLVGLLTNNVPSIPIGFVNICKDINKNNTTINYNINNVIPISKIKEVSEFITYKRNWNGNDYLYWNSYYLPLDYLSYKKVFPVETAYKNNSIIYADKSNNPCYCYQYGVVNDKSIVKLYLPYTSRNSSFPRFFTNNKSALECFNDIQGGECLLITKSTKDKLVFDYIIEDITTKKMHLIFLKGKYTTIAFSSESARLSPLQYEGLSKLYKKIIINVDNDGEGIRCANYHKAKYNIDFFMLGRGVYGNVLDKDISDYVHNNGK